LPSPELWGCIIRRFRPLASGPIAALDDRPGKEPKITAEAKAWLVLLACRKATDLGYSHELCTTRLLAHRARSMGQRRATPALDKLVRGTVCKIRDEQAIRAHLQVDESLARPTTSGPLRIYLHFQAWVFEGFFSKLARSVVRHICVASKQELKDRIAVAMDDINQRPVVHTLSYKLAKAA
jgi:hypothetical protein